MAKKTAPGIFESIRNSVSDALFGIEKAAKAKPKKRAVKATPKAKPLKTKTEADRLKPALKATPGKSKARKPKALKEISQPKSKAPRTGKTGSKLRAV